MSVKATEEPDERQRYFVVRNHEEQYSIWRTDLRLPDGWEIVGDPAPKSVCLDRVDELWTDMRPAGLRRSMDGQAANRES